MSYKMHDVWKVANYFLYKADGCLTPIKVQKLCYFAQGWSLAISDEPLFMEDIEAWKYGPVIRELYNRVKHYGADPIANFDVPQKDEFDDNQIQLMDRVWEIYGPLGGLQLSALTHKEGTPWDTVYNSRGENAVIPNDLIKQYFRKRLQQSS